MGFVLWTARSKPLGPDPGRIVSQEDQQVRHGLDEPGRPADIAGRLLLRRPAVRDQVIEADPTDGSRLVLRSCPCVDKCHLEPTVLDGTSPQLVVVDPVLGPAYGVDQTEGRAADAR